MTMATVVPIGTSPDTAKEILRGVAQYQERFNASGPSRALEVAIVNENSPNGVTSLAEDLSNSSIQGVLGMAPMPIAVRLYRSMNKHGLPRFLP